MIQELDPKKLIDYNNNAKNHPKEQIAKLSRAFKAEGFHGCVIADENLVIIAGHGRKYAAIEAGLETIPVQILTGLSDEQKRSKRLGDNKLAESDWLDDILKQELSFLNEANYDITLSGFEHSFIEEEAVNTNDPDECPLVDEVELRCALGDIWQLGEHQLMCGDSTDEANVLLLLKNIKVDISLCSPPYNVGKTPNGNEKKYLNDSDDKSNSDYLNLLNSSTKNMIKYSKYSFVNIQSLSGNKLALIEYLHDFKEYYADTIIWDKETSEPAMAKNVLNSRFEYVHIFSEKANRVIGTKIFRGTIPNIFQLNSRKNKDYAKIHKATFPIDFPEYFINNFSNENEVILDLFGGTGTTLIACEKNRRKCFTMELDHKYASVIVERWEKYTGKKAVKFAQKNQ